MSQANDRYAGKDLLCSGGPLDSQTRAVVSGSVFRAPWDRGDITTWRPGEATIEFAEYHRQEIAFIDGRRTAVWVLAGMAGDEALRAALRYLGENDRAAEGTKR